MAPEPEANSFDALEARLAALKRKMEQGLPQRLAEFVAARARLAGGDASARDDVRRVAHKLRGTAGSYGFPELGELAGRVEQLASSTEPDAEVVSGSAAFEDALRSAAGGRSDASVVGAGPAGAGTAGAGTVAPPVKAEPKRAMSHPAPSLEGLSVLAADDDDATRKLLELTLVQLGRMKASVFDRAVGLLRELEQRPSVDLVVVDAMMPEMNGLEFLEAVVAKDLQGRCARFVVLSAATVEELGWKLPAGLRVGWLRKPFRPRELLTALEAQRDAAG